MKVMAKHDALQPVEGSEWTPVQHLHTDPAVRLVKLMVLSEGWRVRPYVIG